jgi:hypothetical protein
MFKELLKFLPKKLSSSSQNMGLGSGIRDPGKTYSGSRIQGSKRHRIPDPDSQHCKDIFRSNIRIKTETYRILFFQINNFCEEYRYLVRV